MNNKQTNWIVKIIKLISKSVYDMEKIMLKKIDSFRLDKLEI